MRIETGSFRVDYQPNDKFVVLLRVDASKIGGTLAEGDFIAGRFHPKRNMSFTVEDMGHIASILKQLNTYVKW